MGKSTISLAMFMSYFDITRGYFGPAASHWLLGPGPAGPAGPPDEALKVDLKELGTAGRLYSPVIKHGWLEIGALF